MTLAAALDRAHARSGRTVRFAAVAPILAGALTVTGAVAAIRPWPVGVFQDDGIYVVLAKSLASGEGYRYLNIPGHPAATHYPPGYPAFLAVLWWMWPSFPANVLLFKVANAILLAAASVGTYAFARRRLALTPHVALAASLAATVSIPALILGGLLLSEPLFLALLLPTLLACEHTVDADARDRDALLAGVLGGALALVRSLGVVALPATVAVLVLRRRFRPASIVLATGAAMLAPWQLWVAAHDGELPRVLLGRYGSYTAWLAGGLRDGGMAFVLGVARRNTTGLIELAHQLSATTGRAPVLRWAATVALVALLALGVARARRTAPVTIATLALYLAVVWVWPFGPDRFVWGVWPLVTLSFAVGALAVRDWRPGPASARLVRAGGLAAAAALVVGYAAYNVVGARRGLYEAIPRRATERVEPFMRWVTDHTRPDDVLATDDDVMIHLYTGRLTVPSGTFTPREYLRPQSNDEAARALRDIVAAYAPRYVLVSTRIPGEAALTLARATPPELAIVARPPGGAVFAPPPLVAP